jgi:hypothetical protein
MTTHWRFAIAHELAHLILYRSKAVSPAGKSEYWQVEALCDAFARRLLVGDTEVRHAVNRSLRTGVELLPLSSRIASKARVPWSAAAYRVTDIDSDCIFLRVERIEESFKVVMSTLPKRRAVGQKIKPGSLLHARFSELAGASVLVTIEPMQLAELSGVGNHRTGAARFVSRSIRVALAPADARQAKLNTDGFAA